jgi:hypothetical protein
LGFRATQGERNFRPNPAFASEEMIGAAIPGVQNNSKVITGFFWIRVAWPERGGRAPSGRGFPLGRVRSSVRARDLILKAIGAAQRATEPAQQRQHV